MPLLRRAVGSLSRRFDRPELIGALYPGERETLREEVAMRAVLANALSADSTYVDVGTNRGQVLREAVRVAADGRHVAFEPIPRLAADVRSSFANVDCRELALGAQPGAAEFCHFRALDGWSGLRRSPEISDERGEPEYITVTISTLDVELGELRPSVVKIDVEGAELGVLEGARNLLERVKPLLIIEHVASAAALYGTTSAAIWELFADAGYRVFSLTGEGPVSRAAFGAGEATVNWLAVPASVDGRQGSG